MNIDYKKKFCDTFARRYKINIENKMISDYWFEIIEDKDKEIERLNNIINELKRYIGNEYYCFDNESLEFKIAKDILDKLQELKGSDKE